MIIPWMEELLHQLVYGLSPYNPMKFTMFHSYLTVANWCRISSFHSMILKIGTPTIKQPFEIY